MSTFYLFQTPDERLAAVSHGTARDNARALRRSASPRFSVTSAKTVKTVENRRPVLPDDKPGGLGNTRGP
jgi:hypothetical protein